MSLLRRLAYGLGLAAPAPPAPAPPPTGATTKRNVQGYSGQDALWAHAQAERLFGPFNPRVIPDRVLKWMSSDWTIGFCQEIWLSGFGAVDYFFEGGSPELRAWLEEAIMDRLPQWREVLLRALPYGRQTCELVWEVEDVAYAFAETPEKGTVERTRIASYVPGDLRDLDPEIVEILAGPLGDFAGIRYGDKEITPERLVHVVNESEFGDLLGRPLNQRAYIPWWRGNYALILCDRYLEKKGDPPIIGFAPTEERIDADGNKQNPVRVMGAGLANIRSGSSYTLPNEFDPESKQPLWAVKTLEVAQRAPEFLAVIDRHEHNKRLAWLIPGQLGSGGGSFASDKVAQQLVDRMFDRRLQALILSPINRTILPRMVALNFPGAKRKDIPSLCAGSMASDSRAQFLEILKQCAQLDTVLPDGRVAKVVHLMDLTRGIRKAGIPRTDMALIPDAPIAPAALGGAGPNGRPKKIAQEDGRPPAPGRPGQLAAGSYLEVA